MDINLFCPKALIPECRIRVNIKCIIPVFCQQITSGVSAVYLGVYSRKQWAICVSFKVIPIPHDSPINNWPSTS